MSLIHRVVRSQSRPMAYNTVTQAHMALRSPTARKPVSLSPPGFLSLLDCGACSLPPSTLHRECSPCRTHAHHHRSVLVPSWGCLRAKILNSTVGEPWDEVVGTELPPGQLCGDTGTRPGPDGQAPSLEPGCRPAGRRGSAGQCLPCTCANITFYEAWKEQGSVCPGVFFGGAGKTSFSLICLTW